jgi:pimeloyl-ACP methyl ester carboxylesterase
VPTAAVNGISLDYETAGDPSAPPLLLISGLGAQRIAWPAALLDALVALGFRVITFDNRDVGHSTWFDDVGEADLMGVLTGTASPAYGLGDMAGDAAGLLDTLDVPSAHVLGVSVGGMIAQRLAIDHPSRVASLVSVMSTTGDPNVGAAHPEALAVVALPPAEDRAGAIEQGLTVRRAIGSPGYPTDDNEARATITAAYDRASHPAGTGRQLAAIAGAADRTEALRRLDCPTLVIHGEADLLVDPSGGRATAAAIPAAELVLVPGMGHDLPPGLVSELSARVAAHCHRHDARLG